MNNERPFHKKILKTLITICLTLPTALLVVILSLSLKGKPYSLRDVLLFTPIIAFVLFWIVLLIVNQYLRLRSHLEVKDFKEFLNFKSLITVFIPLLLFIAMLTWILLSVENLQGVNYLPPNFKYQLRIIPDTNSTGEICIEQIENYRGDIFINNNAIKDLQITGDWQQNNNRCLFYLKSGNQGVINIDYVGAIDDTLTLYSQHGPGGGAFTISSSPGQTDKLNLISENNELVSTKFKMGTFLLRNITDWGILAGLFSAALIILMVIYLIEKKWAEKNLKKPSNISTTIQKFKNILSQSFSDKTALFILFFIFIIGAILTILITRPLAVGPSHFGDEIFYWETAVSLYDGSYSPSQFTLAPPFYPISILPAFYLFYPENAYLGAKILNALYLTSAIFPAYLLLRIFLDQKKSIIIASLLLLNPAQIIFAPRILSENLFLPLLLWTILLGFKTYDQPDKRKHWMSFLFGALLSLLYLTRYIGLAIIPVLILAWWFKPENGSVLDLRTLFKKKIKSFVWVLIPMGVILGAWIVIGMADGLTTTESVGFHASASPKPWLTINRFLLWGVFYASYTILLAAPFVPILLSSILDFKNLDAERKRWLAALLLMVAFVLIVCIRHSWRSAYNFPVPLKIQGRYIFFFNHLFLISAAISLASDQRFSKRLKILVYSGLIVSLAYAIIQIGFIFLDHPLKASVSSAFGRFMDAYGPGFLTFSLILILLFTFLPDLKKSLSKSIAFLFILGFYILGDIEVYKIQVREYSQLYNSQIYYLITEGFSQCENYSNRPEEVVKIYYRGGSEDLLYSYWKGTLDFYGMPDAELIPDNRIEKSGLPIFRAAYGDCKIKLRYLHEEDFQTSTNPKFSYGPEYFDYQKEE